MIRVPVMLGLELLAEQAGDMASFRREAVVHGGGDQHLDNRLFRPAMLLRIIERTVHVIEGRRNDDARLMMLARFRQASEARQFR
jgi:hypothetical protein